MNNGAITLVNSTPTDIRGFLEREIRASIAATGALPEELADLFTLRVVVGSDGNTRHILEAA